MESEWKHLRQIVTVFIKKNKQFNIMFIEYYALLINWFN